MSKLKSLSRARWMIVGIVATLILVPSGVAVPLSFTGIQGTSGHNADVSEAGQLLTVPALPANYKDFGTAVNAANGANGGLTNVSAVTVPSGEAFIAQQVKRISGQQTPRAFTTHPTPAIRLALTSAFMRQPQKFCGEAQVGPGHNIAGGKFARWGPGDCQYPNRSGLCDSQWLFPVFQCGRSRRLHPGDRLLRSRG